MIISHKHKYIFIKTEKTAGTSIEIALSKYCGPKDIITPIVEEGELKRSKLGYRGPQNFKIPFSKYSKCDLMNCIDIKRRLTFYHHNDATFIKRHIDKDIWDSYYKFCFERNPFDKVISWYFWQHKKEPRPTISEFIESGEANLVKGFQLYTTDSIFAVDKVYFFEDLDKSMEDIAEKVGLPEVPQLPKTKANLRKDKRSYRDILSQKDKENIEKIFAREIAYFNYKW